MSDFGFKGWNRWHIVLVGIFGLSCQHASKSSSDPLLIGGKPAPKGKFLSHLTQLGSECGAVVLTSKFILTAGHCVVQSVDENGALMPGVREGEPFAFRQSQADFSLEDFPKNMSGVAMQIKKIHVHPTWTGSLTQTRNPTKAAEQPGTSDLAIIELGPFDPKAFNPDVVASVDGYHKPKKIEFPAASLDWKAPKVGENITIGGTGCDLGAPYPTYALKIAGKLVSEVTPTALVVPPENTDGSPLSRACTGDSGGPAYRIANDGSESIVGINSYYLPGAGLQPTVLARIDVVKAWIEGILQSKQ